MKAALHRGRERLREPEGAAASRRPLPSPELLDRFIERYDARDVQGLTALMLDGASAENVGNSFHIGLEPSEGVPRFLHAVVHGHAEWPPEFQPSSARVERVEFEGEPILLVLRHPARARGARGGLPLRGAGRPHRAHPRLRLLPRDHARGRRGARRARAHRASTALRRRRPALRLRRIAGVRLGAGARERARETQRRAFEANVRKSYAYGFLMDFSLTAPIWVLYLRDERGLSLTQITLLEVPLFLLIVLAEVPTGAVADRFGRRVSLHALRARSWRSPCSSTASRRATPCILISNLAWGLAFTFRSGADTALLYDSLKQAGREGDFQRINGRFWALRSSAMLAGLLLGAPIAAATSYTFAITLERGHPRPARFLVALRHARAESTRASTPREPYLRTLASGVRDAWRRPTLRYIFLFSGDRRGGRGRAAAPAPAAVAGRARRRYRPARLLAGARARRGDPLRAGGGIGSSRGSASAAPSSRCR